MQVQEIRTHTTKSTIAHTPVTLKSSPTAKLLIAVFGAEL